MVFSTKLVAITLGIIVGVGVAAPIFLSMRLLRSKAPQNAVYGAMGSVFGGMLLSLGLMLAYWFAAPAGFMYFALALVGSFAVSVAAGGLVMARRTHRSQETEK